MFALLMMLLSFSVGSIRSRPGGGGGGDGLGAVAAAQAADEHEAASALPSG